MAKDSYIVCEEVEWVKESIQKAAKIHNMNVSAKNNSFPLRPSAALKSNRDLYYGIENYYNPGSIPVDPIEGRNTMLLDLGHVIERHLIEWTERAFAVTARNQRVMYGVIKGPSDKTISLGGEFDFVITSSSTGEQIICDSKSSADFPFKSALPKDEHIAQINLYLHSDWARYRKINKAWILYYNKNTSELRVFEFKYNESKAMGIVEKFQVIMDMYIESCLPERQYVFGCDWQATYTQFKTHDNAEFTVPVDKRKVVTINIHDANLPEDRKELIKWIATSQNSGKVWVTETRRIWLELGATTLLLKEERIK